MISKATNQLFRSFVSIFGNIRKKLSPTPYTFTFVFSGYLSYVRRVIICLIKLCPILSVVWRV